MKPWLVVATIAGMASSAQAGCLTGAAVGGVAGHYAGHHAVLGAAAGCAVGHHQAAVHRRDAAAANAANQAPAPAPAYNGGSQPSAPSPQGAAPAPQPASPPPSR